MALNLLMIDRRVYATAQEASDRPSHRTPVVIIGEEIISYWMLKRKRAQPYL